MKSLPRRENNPDKGLARMTINLIIKLIKKALREAVRLEIIPRNPADKIELLAEDKKERGILTPKEIEQLFQQTWPDERSEAASILASVSGMRINEITALRIEDLDMDQAAIHVRHSYSAYEKRLKGTKNEKPRTIYTDLSILKMLSALYQKNPWKNSFIFWGQKAGLPMPNETISNHLEKTLAVIMGEKLEGTVNQEWRALASILAKRIEIERHEMVAVQANNLNTRENYVSIRYRYRYSGKNLEKISYEEEKRVPLEASLIKRLTLYCEKNPHVFIIRGVDHETPLNFENLEQKDAEKMSFIMGEIVRTERNLTFHGFWHFFNSTIRGSVADDILRLQTGHLDKKQTDNYDHMTEDRGEQLRNAVRSKILPFIPKVAGA